MKRLFLITAIIAAVAAVACGEWNTKTVSVGTQPAGIAVNPVTNKIYVANYGSANVSVINGSTYAVEAIVNVGTNPTQVAANPVTNKIYVSNYGGKSVTMINGNDNSTTTTTVGSYPGPLVVDPVTDSVYVLIGQATSGKDSVAVLKGSTNAFQTTIKVGGGTSTGASCIAVNPATGKAYVGCTENSTKVPTVTRITESDNGTSVITIGGYTSTASCVVRGVAVNPATNKIYAGWGNDTVSVIDGSAETVTKIFIKTNVNPKRVAVNPATNKIYVSCDNTSSNAYVIDGSNNSVTSIGGTYSAILDVVVNPITNRKYIISYTSGKLQIIRNDESWKAINTGTNPQGVAVNPVTNKIFVTNFGDNTVSVFEGSGDYADAPSYNYSVAAGTNPRAVAVNPVTNKIYMVLGGGKDSVVVIDGSTNTFLARVNVGSKPVALAVNPLTDTIYVANYNGNSVSAIKGSDNTVYTLSVGTASNPNNYPIALAVNPVAGTKGMIYVANYGDTSFTVINGDTHATTTVRDTFYRSTTGIGVNPIAVAVNPVTNTAYIANYGSRNITAIYKFNNYTDYNLLPTGMGPIAIAVNRVTNKVYVANDSSGTVKVFGALRGDTAMIAVRKNPKAIAVNEMTNRIYVADTISNTGRVHVINGDTRDTSSVGVQAYPYALAVNPVMNKIYVGHWTSNTYAAVIDGATKTIVNTNPTYGGTRSVAVNPVTFTAYFADSAGNNCRYILDPPTYETQVKAHFTNAPAGNVTSSSTFSFDGRAANFWTTKTRIEGMLLYLNTAQSGPWTLPALTYDDAGDDSAHWSGWTTPTLVSGENFVLGVPIESDVSITNNLGRGTPMAGNMLVYPLYCNYVASTGAAEIGGNRQDPKGGIKLRPNPFTSFVRIPGHEGERFEVYDIMGRKAGTYKGDRIGERLAAGVYFMRPEGGNAKPLRIVKIR
jgi:YVTN family beta-propeller protein